MLPPTAVLNRGHRSATDPVLRSQVTGRRTRVSGPPTTRRQCRGAADLFNLLLGQLGVAVLGTEPHVPVVHAVLGVVLRRTQVQVSETDTALLAVAARVENPQRPRVTVRQDPCGATSAHELAVQRGAGPGPACSRQQYARAVPDAGRSLQDDRLSLSVSTGSVGQQPLSTQAVVVPPAQAPHLGCPSAVLSSTCYVCHTTQFIRKGSP